MGQIILLLVVSIFGAAYDLKYRKIPNWLTFGTFLLVLIVNVIHFEIGKIINCVLGFVLGIAILFVPYVLKWMGAGDAKLLGAIGSIVGFKQVLIVFFYSAIAGLFLAIIWLIFLPERIKFLVTTGQILPSVDNKQKLPYGIAITLGTILYIILKEKNYFSFLPF